VFDFTVQTPSSRPHSFAAFASSRFKQNVGADRPASWGSGPGADSPTGSALVQQVEDELGGVVGAVGALIGRRLAGESAVERFEPLS
jgi:hypothetical protein